MLFDVCIHVFYARFKALSKLFDADQTENANQAGENDVLQDGLAVFAAQNGLGKILTSFHGVSFVFASFRQGALCKWKKGKVEVKF